MASTTSLVLVIRVSTDRRDGAALALAGAQRQADEARRKLQMLTRYRLDYAAGGNGGAQARSTDPVRIANTRAFIDKLEQAIAEQQREVAARESHADTCLKQLIAKAQKLKALEILRDRRADDAGRAETRSEQKRTDEFGARAARSGGATLDAQSA